VLESLPEGEKLFFWISYRNRQGSRFRQSFEVKRIDIPMQSPVVGFYPDQLSVKR
jgi:hypothetical protein